MNWNRCLLPLVLAVVTTYPLQAVNYRVTFDATWTADNHGDNYPGPNAHYSTPIGTTHSAEVDFWEPGTLASDGVELVAETGSVRLFRQEIQAAIDAGNAFGFVQGATFNSPGSQTRVFEAAPEFPYFSYISMIAPTPDWFVGADSVNLRDENGWVPEITIDLHPYDSGTEDGTEFKTSNLDTNPADLIKRLDTDADSRLFETAPFGVLRIELLPLCDINGDGQCNATDLSSTNGLFSAGDLIPGVEVIIGENSRLDLNDDGIIDLGDRDAWLADAARQNGFSEPYLLGDTNLNDHVGFGDFTALSVNFGTGREWTEGNYDGTGNTDFLDFLALSANFGQAISAQLSTAAVPEPSSRVLATVCFLGLLLCRRRN